MKAVILAAGKGDRLKKITSRIPKPMIEFRGKPILEHNIELCKKFGMTEIFINTHHLPEVIKKYFGDGSRFGVAIQYSYEEKLLGTAGAVKNFERLLGHEPFYVIYGDNYSEYNLHLLKEKSEQSSAVAVIGFHWREDTEASGVAEFTENGCITRFIEKPKNGESDSHWVNAGVYYLRSEIMNYIPAGISDFAKDIFPKLLASQQKLYGVCCKSNVIAFDTPEMYSRSFKL